MHPPETANLFIGHTEPDSLQFDACSDRPLLVSLEQGGSDWPSSCRVGNCRTCIGQLQSGSVRYEIEWPGLAPEEHKQGYLLPCVAIPCSDVRIKAGY